MGKWSGTQGRRIDEKRQSTVQEEKAFPCHFLLPSTVRLGGKDSNLRPPDGASRKDPVLYH